MRVLWITAFIVLIDQASKVVIRSTMYLGQSIPVLGDWFRITFTQNPGMAFGITFGPRMVVTVLSVLITLLLIGYLWRVKDGHLGYRACLALILGGAIGNIIDRVFYGRIFGYGELFYGEVVDFIHFNVWSGTVAEWLPLIGGRYIALFPIWNVADMAIVIGVAVIVIFQKKFEVHGQPAADQSAYESMASPGGNDRTHVIEEAVESERSDGSGQRVPE